MLLIVRCLGSLLETFGVLAIFCNAILKTAGRSGKMTNLCHSGSMLVHTGGRGAHCEGRSVFSVLRVLIIGK